MWYPKCHRSLTLFNLVERLIAIRWMEPLEKMLPPHWCSCCYLSMALATNQSNNTTMSIAQSTADSSVFFLNIRLYVLNEDIRSNDVLFGGGGSEIENHHDTSQFLRVVLLWKRLYKATRSNERKTELAKRVVSTVSRNRGRFLRPADDIEAQELGIPTGVGMAWVMVDPDFAIEKTRQLLRGGHNDNNAVDTLRDSEKVELDCPINTIAVDGLSHFESTPETNGAIVKHEPQPPSVSRQSTMDHKNANRLPKSLTHSTKWADSQFRSRTRIEAENWIDITNTSPATRPTSANLSPSLAGTMSIFTNAARLDSSAHKMMRQRALERQCRQEQKAHQENAQLRQILLTSERQRRLEEHQGRFQASLSWCCGLSLPG